jgi:hypothetical protein
MSGDGYGCATAAAPLTLITAFLRLASSSTFGRSARPRGRHVRLQDRHMADDEARMGWRSISAITRINMLTGRSCLTAARAIGPGRDRRNSVAAELLRQHDADADRARVRFRSATTSAAGSSGSTGLTIATADGRVAPPPHSSVVAVQGKAEMKIAPSMPSFHRRHRRHRWRSASSAHCAGRFGVFAS